VVEWNGTAAETSASGTKRQLPRCTMMLEGGALTDIARKPNQGAGDPHDIAADITRWARLQLRLRLDDGPKQPDAYFAIIAHE
jgi:hypothetical protein